MEKKELEKRIMNLNANVSKNPLDDYEKIKNLIVEDKGESLDIVWDILSPNLKKQLEESDATAGIIKKHRKKIGEKVKELGVAYMFTTIEKYKEWKREQKKPYSRKVRHTIFTIEVLTPIMYDNMDIMFNHMSAKAENCAFQRITKSCSKCQSKMIYRKIKDKFTCSVCANIEDGKSTHRNLETINGVGVDLSELPTSQVYGQAFVKFLELVFWNYGTKETKASEKKLKK